MILPNCHIFVFFSESHTILIIPYNKILKKKKYYARIKYFITFNRKQIKIND